MLEKLTVDDFRPAVGGRFTIDGGELGAIDLELAEASTVPSGAPAVDESGTRSPFHLIFRGPPEPVLAQQICPLEHETLGRLEVFLVPIGRDDAGTRYEAVFS